MSFDLEPPFCIIKPGYTEEDFYRIADEDSDWEYLDGRIVMHSPASDRHEELFLFLIALLKIFLDKQGGAVVRGSRYPMRLDARWSPEPDILVVRRSRLHRMKPRRLEGPADLVMEISSESDPNFEAREKLPRYQKAGIEEIWIVSHQDQSVQVYTRTPSGYTSRVVSTGRLRSTVLPGFWIDASWLWKRELPSTLGCLKKILGE